MNSEEELVHVSPPLHQHVIPNGTYRSPALSQGTTLRTIRSSKFSHGCCWYPYNSYDLAANRSTSYLASYRAIVRKYQHKEPAQILRDLISSTPGEEGKWFPAAMEAGLLGLAMELANRSPCDPRKLSCTARDFVDENPSFSLAVGLAALRWLGYEITAADVWEAYSHMMKAAERLGQKKPKEFASASADL